MSIKPPISIPFEFNTSTPVDFISDGPWAGFPFKWQIEVTISPQPHSDDTSQTLFQYDGLDVRVGDWLGTQEGVAVQVVSITSANTTSTLLDCIVEDINLFNVFSDPTISGIGLASATKGVLFRIDDEGMPIIYPAPTDFVTPFSISNIVSRFQLQASAPFKNWIEANNSDNFLIKPVAASSNAIAIGNAANALKENSISFGSSAISNGTNSIAIGDNITVDEDNSIAFGTDGDIKFYINSSGNAGINTNNPSALLDIINNNTSDSFIQIKSQTISADRGIKIGIPNGTNDLKIINEENANLTLQTGGFERFKIDTSGYVNFNHGGFNTLGDANYKLAILKTTSVDNDQEYWLTLPDNDELDMPDNTAWIFEVDILGKQQGGIIAGGYRHKGLIVRANGANTVSFVEQPFEELIGESVSAYGWSTGVSADPLTGGLRVFGMLTDYSTPNPVNWLAMVKITEINF